MSDHWLLPVYREGFASPMYPHHRSLVTPFRGPAYMDQEFNQMRREMQRMMDDVFPFHRPGEFPGSNEPSALAPKKDDQDYVVHVDAKDFKPNEVTIKTTAREGHNFLMVEGKHETQDQQGYHSICHFKRQYMIPDNVDPNTFTSKLDKNGMWEVRTRGQLMCYRQNA